MATGKNMITLDADYYSAFSYMEEEENKKTIFTKVVIQLFILLLISMALFFAYKFITKIDSSTISLFNENLEKSKRVATEKREEVVVNKSSKSITKEEIAEVVQTVILEMNKREESKETKREVLPVKKAKNEALTQEYIDLVKKSLGNN